MLSCIGKVYQRLVIIRLQDELDYSIPDVHLDQSSHDDITQNCSFFVFDTAFLKATSYSMYPSFPNIVVLVTSRNGDDINNQLQAIAHNTVTEYFRVWKIEVNANKCGVAFFTKRRLPLSDTISIMMKNILWSPYAKYRNTFSTR